MEFTLKDICYMQSGGTPKSTNHLFYGGKIPWVTISDFKNSEGDVLYKTEQTITEDGLAAINGRFFKKNTLLLAMYGSVGKTAILGVDASTNQAILGISSKDESVLNIKFLKYWLDHNKDFLYSQGKGATLHNISLTVVQRQKINLPDLETQNKIVAILDKAKAILDKREETIKKYDELLRATFLEMFGDPVKNEKGWETIALKNIVKIGTGGTPSRKNDELYFNGNINWAKTTEVKGEYIYSTEEKITEAALKDSNCKVYPVNTVLIAMYGQGKTRGNVGLLKIESATNQACAAIPPNDKINQMYLFSLLKLQYDRLRTLSRGGNQENLNLRIIGDLVIQNPPMTLQSKFEAILDKIATTNVNIINSKKYIENLVSSLTQQAFKGEIDFNTAVDLEVLLENDYQFFKENSNSGSIKLLLERLNTNELNENKFYEQQTYDKAKSFVFELIKEGKVKQVFDEKTKKVTLTV